jgi:hypothetical protein
MVSYIVVMMMYSHTIHADVSDIRHRPYTTSTHAASPPPHRRRSGVMRRLASTSHSRAALRLAVGRSGGGCWGGYGRGGGAKRPFEFPIREDLAEDVVECHGLLLAQTYSTFVNFLD